MVLGTGYGKDHMCLLDSRGGLVMPSSVQPDMLQEQQQQHRQWIPDERDAFISWLRGEFAAANAIIDAMCHHLQMSGKPGEYDVVLTCIQARRYNWTIVLHMQQYFSVAEVNFALQQVIWQRKQSLHPEQQSQLPQPQQFYTRVEAALDEGGTSKQMTNGVHDPRDLRGDFLIPKSVATAHQQSGLENPHQATQILASAGQSDIASDQKATGSENHANCQIAPAIVGIQSLKQEEGQHPATVKTTKCYSCLEPVDGKMTNVAEGLELFENVLDSAETNQLTAFINDIQAAGRRGSLTWLLLAGRTFTSGKKGFNGKGRGTIYFGYSHSDAYSDISQPMPACVQVIVNRLVAGHLIPPSKIPDSCTIHILDEGDYLPPHVDHSHVERPFYTLTLLSECSLVLGHSLTMDAPGEFKGAFHLSLPVGSVLVLQGNSADIARHALSSSPIKRVTITLGKLLPSKTSRVPPQIARLPHPAAAAAAPISPLSRPPAVDGYIPTQSAKGSGFPNMKPHVLGPISGVLPVPTIRLPGVAQVLPSVSSVPNSSLKPLFPTAAVNHSSTYSPTAVVPQAPWSVMPRPLPPSRVPSTGTGVFFPSGWVSSGPGRPVATSQHRQPPLLQKTNSLPSLFVSPAHSGSPTKNLKASASSSQLSSDGPQGERTPLLVSNSTSLSNSGTSDEVPGKEPAMDISPPSVINDINSKKKD
ncbi:unnamed protein product [Sphagnum troendelagicum]